MGPDRQGTGDRGDQGPLVAEVAGGHVGQVDAGPTQLPFALAIPRAGTATLVIDRTLVLDAEPHRPEVPVDAAMWRDPDLWLGWRIEASQQPSESAFAITGRGGRVQFQQFVLGDLTDHAERNGSAVEITSPEDVGPTELIMDQLQRARSQHASEAGDRVQ